MMNIRIALLGLLLAGTTASHATVTVIDLTDYLVTPIEFTSTGFTSADIVSNDGFLTLRAAAGAGDNAADFDPFNPSANGIGDPADTLDDTGTAAYQAFSGGSAFNGDGLFSTDPKEYVLNGDENFDIIFASPQHFFGGVFFDTADDSIFTLSFFSGTTLVDTFTLPPVSAISNADFNLPLPLGLHVTTAFDAISVRERDDFVSRTNSDEFFQFLRVQEVPAPATLALLAAGMFGVGAARRRT